MTICCLYLRFYGLKYSHTLSFAIHDAKYFTEGNTRTTALSCFFTSAADVNPYLCSFESANGFIIVTNITEDWPVGKLFLANNTVQLIYSAINNTAVLLI